MNIFCLWATSRVRPFGSPGCVPVENGNGDFFIKRLRICKNCRGRFFFFELYCYSREGIIIFISVIVRITFCGESPIFLDRFPYILDFCVH